MKNNMNSNHYNKDRRYREKVVQMIGEGTIIKVMTIDKGHLKGPEVHELSDTGIITVWNYNHTKIITKLIARPGQVKRYYKDTDTVPTELMMLAKEHLKLHYNRQNKRKLKNFLFFLAHVSGRVEAETIIPHVATTCQPPN